jgi:hypothetical protein
LLWQFLLTQSQLSNYGFARHHGVAAAAAAQPQVTAATLGVLFSNNKLV